MSYNVSHKAFDVVPSHPVVHVTKEFAWASMGGLGSIVTALAKHQAEAGMDVRVLMPFYAYLREYPVKFFEQEPYLRRTYHVKVRTIFAGGWKLALNWLRPREWHSITFDLYEVDFYGVKVQMVSPGHEYPFNLCFSGMRVDDIYDVKFGITFEWQHLFFATAIDTIMRESEDDAMFHFHGASNGLALLLGDERRHKIVYSMHDHSFEPSFTIPVSDIQVFSPGYDEIAIEIRKYVHGNKLFISPVAISRSDAVVYVSELIGQELINGMLDFDFQALLLPVLREHAERGSFFAISNGIDINSVNPFTHQTLREFGLTVQLSDDVATELFGGRSQVRSSLPLNDAKGRAKDFIRERFILDECETLGIFIGRFSVDKGIDVLIEALGVDSELPCMVLIGQYNDYPATKIRGIVSSRVALLDTPELQAEIGPIARLAADFAIMPSRTESFGLVAVEALLFGSCVVTTGVGGLREFLRDHDEDNWNAFLFDHNKESLIRTLKQASNTLIDLHRKRNLEEKRWFWISDALNLRWDSSRKIYSDGTTLKLSHNRSFNSPLKKYFAVHT